MQIIRAVIYALGVLLCTVCTASASVIVELNRTHYGTFSANTTITIDVGRVPRG